MTPSGPRAGAGDAPGRHTVTEERLRAAFAARAALVTYRDLRREEPPRGRSRGTRRVRGFVLAGLGSVAAAAAAYALFLGRFSPRRSGWGRPGVRSGSGAGGRGPVGRGS